MARTKSLQTNFSAGELAPDLGMRQDTEQYQNGAKDLHNRRCLIGGGTVRRPGTWLEQQLAGPSRILSWIVNRTTQYVIRFGDADMHAFVRDIDTGEVSAAGSLSGCLWTGDIWQEMVVRQAGNSMFLTHTGMPPQIITRTGAATWTVGDFEFASGPGSRPEQPYLKFADDDVTLTCSDVTGSITLTISGSTAWFTADHVGTYIRYHKKACLITAVAADGLSCTATVIERLPETYDLTVAASASFAVGEIVEGSATGAKAIITSIPDSTSIFVVLTETLIPFTTSDTLIGPNATTTISVVATATNAAVTDWDEQMFSDVWGYPSCVELHRNRLLFGGHLTAPDYLVGSALGNIHDFNVGDGSDSDAILESIGDTAASRIVQLHSAEQLLVATDNGLYYVPEGSASPFRPTSIAFFPFGSPWPISAVVKMQAFDGGVLCVSGSIVIKARPTGDSGRAWDADEVSLLSPHLFDNPTDLAVTTGYAGGPERYALFRNDDGGIAAMQLVEAQRIRNVTHWHTHPEPSTFTSVAAIEADVYATAVRLIAGNTIYTLERFDQDVTLDAATQFDAIDDIEGVYGTTSVNVVAGNFHLGATPLALSDDEIPAGPYIAGFDYDSVIELLPPAVTDNEGNHAGDVMRIVECYVHTLDSARFEANGHELTAYQWSDDPSVEPPLKTGPQRFQFLGWQREPTIRILQTDPLPLKVLAVSTVVAY